MRHAKAKMALHYIMFTIKALGVSVLVIICLMAAMFFVAQMGVFIHENRMQSLLNMIYVIDSIVISLIFIGMWQSLEEWKNHF